MQWFIASGGVPLRYAVGVAGAEPARELEYNNHKVALRRK